MKSQNAKKKLEQRFVEQNQLGELPREFTTGWDASQSVVASNVPSNSTIYDELDFVHKRTLIDHMNDVNTISSFLNRPLDTGISLQDVTPIALDQLPHSIIEEIISPMRGNIERS